MIESFAQVLMLKELYPMAFNTERLKTFHGLQDLFAVSSTELAKNGFYFAGSFEEPDLVRCAFCRGTAKEWKSEDIVPLEHARLFPACPVFGAQVEDT